MKEILKDKLPLHEVGSLVRSYDIIGDIAVIRVPESLLRESQIIAEAVMKTHNHVKSVFRQASAVSGDFRLRRLEWIAGEHRTETTYKEFGCIFKVDLADCYFSPRLSFERMRVARLVAPHEIVVNMFAGVGSFSILMAKHAKVDTVYSIDVNPSAVRFMRENVRLNRVQGQVVPILGDAKEVIVERLHSVADRVLMPLPEKALEYIDYAVMALKPDGGWVHYYDFEHGSKDEDPVDKVKAKVSDKLYELRLDFAIPSARVVRPTGPNWYQVALDVRFGSNKR